MARLGEFQFGIDTAAFQELQRVSSYKWQGKNRIGRKPAQQFTGPDAEKITMNGVIYPHYRGGLGQIGQMRVAASRGQPQILVYAFEQVGQYCGRWCVTDIEETRTVFFDNGMPRKIEFRISLVEYGEDGVDQAAMIAANIASLTAGLSVQLSPGVQQEYVNAQTLATNVTATSGAVADNLATQQSTINAEGAGLGSYFSKAMTAINKVITAAGDFKLVGENANRTLGKTPASGNVISASESINQEAGRIVGIAERASKELSDVFNASIGSGSPSDLVKAMRSAQRSIGNLSRLGSESVATSNQIKDALE